MILFGQNKKHSSENFIFFVHTYKQSILTKKTFENNDIEVIIDGVNTLWLNEKHIEEQLGHKNLPAITNKYDKIYKKHTWISRWTNKTTK